MEKKVGCSSKEDVGIKKRSFWYFFLPKSLTGLEAKERSIWIEKTEVSRLTVELGT